MKPCLYCGDPHAAKTDEHVLQKGLGGTVVLKDEVCGTCNTTVFSSPDGHLVRFVRDLAFHDHPDVPDKRTFILGNHSVTWDREHSLWVSVRLDKTGRPIVFDQIVRARENWYVSLNPAGGPNVTERLQGMLKELETVTPEHLATHVIRRTDPPVEPAVIRSARSRFVVRAATEDEAAKLRNEILGREFARTRFKQISEAKEELTHAPTVHVQSSINHGAIVRALAKLALNVFCHVVGSDEARTPEFGAIRRFAFDGTGYPDDRMVNLITPDEEHMQAAAAMMCPPNHHAVRIQPTAEGIFAWVCLYQRSLAMVQLTSVPPATNPWRLALFNYERGGVRVYDEESLAPLPGDKEWIELSQDSASALGIPSS